MSTNSIGLILGVGVVFYILVLFAVVPALNRKRQALEIAKFGKPKVSPLRAGVMNFVPGLGLWYLGESTKAITINAVLFAVLLAFALFWHSWPLGSMASRVSVVLHAIAVSGLYAESLAQKRWKSDAQN